MPTDHEHPVDAARVAEARKDGLSPEDAGRLGSLLSLLADPVRLRVLYSLDLVDELCVGDLALATDASIDSVGYALRILRTAGLVQTRKSGRVVYYRLADRFPEPLLEHCLRELLLLGELASGTHRGFPLSATSSPGRSGHASLRRRVPAARTLGSGGGRAR